jgi:hypothetical protein
VRESDQIASFTSAAVAQPLIADVTLAKQWLGWTARDSLQEAIEMLVAD